MSPWSIAFALIGGLAVLTAGAEALVRGSARLALMAGISPLVIGLTVVAYGTSTPELVVSLGAGLTGNPDIAVGNVVGSNIVNVLLILGASALVAPLVVARQLVRLEVPILIGVSLLLWALAADGGIQRWEGAALVAGIVLYSAWTIRRSRREVAATSGVAAPSRGVRVVALSLLLVLGGLALLALGGRWFVDGSVALARALGVSDVVIGLTVVALGTSMPELATSIVATLKGQRDIAIGNVVGSSIFNILGILGLSGLVAGTAGLAVDPAVLAFDIPVMTAVAVACLPIFLTGMGIARWEGALFLAYYAAYATYLVLRAAEHDALPAFSAAMLYFAAPLTVAGLAVSLWRQRRLHGAPSSGTGR